MKFCEKKDLYLHIPDILLRSVSNRLNDMHDIPFVSYNIVDDMYGDVFLNNGLCQWDFDIVIGFEI